MPAFKPESLVNGGPGDPYGIDFDPVSNANGLAAYAGSAWTADPSDHSTPVYGSSAPALQPSLTVSLQRPSKTSRISKSRVKLVKPEPVLDAGIATNVKSHENSFDITFMFSEKASIDERYHILQLAKEALNNVTIRTVVGDNKAIY